MKILRFFAALLIVVVVSGCALFKREHKIVLWTDRPEFIAYAEVFNAEQDDYKVEIIYKASPSSEMMKNGSVSGDIVIGSYLNSKKLIDKFKNLNFLFGKNKIDPEKFYAESLEAGRLGKKQLLIPVSFNIPVFLFRRGEVSHDISSFTLNKETLMDICTKFNDTKTKFRKNAFSPLWDPGFLFFFSVLSDKTCMETCGGNLFWDGKKIEENLGSIRSMIIKLYGSFENEKAFRDKYLYKLPSELLETGRIFFTYSDINSFYSIPEDKRKNLNFRFFMNDEGKIPLCEDILYAGITKQASNKKGAAAFLKWFFDPRTQQKFLADAKFKNIRTFGIARGFSSLMEVNEAYIPKFYPLMVGHVPVDGFMDFPSSFPPNWDKIKKEVVISWLFDEAGRDKTSISLDEIMADWYRLNTEY